MSIIQAGKHAATVESVEFGQTKNGNDEAAIVCRITDGDDEGRHITHRVYFTSDKAVEIALKALRNAGLCSLDDVTCATSECPGTDVQLVVEHEEYDGQTKAKSAWLNKPGDGGSRNPFSASQSTSFRDRMKAKMKAANAGKQPTQKEDVPFSM